MQTQSKKPKPEGSYLTAQILLLVTLAIGVTFHTTKRYYKLDVHATRPDHHHAELLDASPAATAPAPQERTAPVRNSDGQSETPAQVPAQRPPTKKLHEAAQAMLKKLETYYGGAGPMEKAFKLRPGDERYDSSIKVLAQKIGRAIQHRDKFVVGTIGSSVTAGHDNCNFDSYQRQLTRLMEPLWKAAGVKFEVRNAGQGGGCGDNYQNQIWCLRNLVGDDVDATHYSWTYFESGSQGKSEAAEVITPERAHEMFVRWSLLMERSPAPLIIYATTAQTEFGGLYNAYAKYGFNVMEMMGGMAAGAADKKWGDAGDGRHSTTRYGEASDVSEERRKSLGVLWRNWHPGPLLFQAAADAIAYMYTKAFVMALKEIDGGKVWPKRPSRVQSSALPAPVDCNSAWCKVDGPPGCTMLEYPRFGSAQFAVVAPDSASNPYKSKHVAGDKGWQEWKAPPSDLIPREERSLPAEVCGHLDHCAALKHRAGEKSGLLTFKLPASARRGFIAVCAHGKHEVLKSSSVTFFVDGKAVPHDSIKEWQGNKKCLTVQARSDGAAAASGGAVYLGIQVSSAAADLGISHVIALPADTGAESTSSEVATTSVSAAMNVKGPTMLPTPKPSEAAVAASMNIKGPTMLPTLKPEQTRVESSATTGAVSSLAAKPGSNPYIKRYVTPDLRAYWKKAQHASDEFAAKLATQFGSWCPGAQGSHCYANNGGNITYLATCDCKDHNWDNTSNMDMARFEFCTGHKIQKRDGKVFWHRTQGWPDDGDTPTFGAGPLPTMPEMLRPVLELNYADLNAEGDLPLAAAFPSGKPQAGELKAHHEPSPSNRECCILFVDRTFSTHHSRERR